VEFRLSGSGRCDVPRGIYVLLPDQEREALFDLADREWRRPRDQASKLISDALRTVGALQADAHLAAVSRDPEAVAR
jgi:hypothetical protein